MMRFSEKKQRGITAITLMVILAILAFFIMLILKIGPIYMNHNKVMNSLNAVEHMPSIQTMSKYDIELSMAKRFNMNYVTKVDLRDLSVLKQGNYVKVEIEYERVEKIVGNLSVLVHFYDYFELGNSE